MKKAYNALVAAMILSALVVFPSGAGAADTIGYKYWTGAGGNDNWNTAGNWNPSGAPGTGNVAVFDGGGGGAANRNSSINVNANLAGIIIEGNYTGTVTQMPGFSVTLGSHGFVQSVSTFIGGNSDITINDGGPFNVLGGSFTSTSGTLVSYDSWTVVNVATFTHNGGTVQISGDYDFEAPISGAVIFNNLTFYLNCCSNSDLTLQAGTTLTVNGTLKEVDDVDGSGSIRLIGSGAIHSLGDVIIQTTNYEDNTVPITLKGTGTQRVYGTYYPVPAMGPMTINKPSGTVLFMSTIAMHGNYAVDPANAGTVDYGTATFIVVGNNTSISPGAFPFHNIEFQNRCCTNMSLTITDGSTVTVNNNLIFNRASNLGQAIIGPGVIFSSGNILMRDDGNGETRGSAVTYLKGIGAQTITGGDFNGTNTPGFPSLIIDKPSGSVAFRKAMVLEGSWIAEPTNLSTFDFTGSTIVFYNGTDDGIARSTVSPSGAIFENVVFNDYNCSLPAAERMIPYGSTLSVNGNLIFQADYTGCTGRPILIGPGIIDARGDLSLRGTRDIWNQGNVAIRLSGTSNQTISQNYGIAFPTGSLTIDKPSGVVTLLSTVTLDATGQDFRLLSGTVDMSSFSIVANDAIQVSGSLIQKQGNVYSQAGSISVTPSGSWINASTGDVLMAGGQTITNDGLVSMNGEDSGCTASDSIDFTRASGGTAVNLAGAGSWQLMDVRITNYSASPALTAYSSTDGTGNSGITFNPACPGFAPSNVQYFGVDVGSVSARWDLIPGNSYLVAISSASNFSVILSSNTAPLNQNATSFANLANNTTYYFKVKPAFDSDAAYSNVIATPTLALPPTSASPAFTAVFSTSIRANWQANGNPSDTLYSVEVATSQSFAGTVTTSNTYNVFLTTEPVIEDSTYSFRVRAIRHDGHPSAYLNIGTTRTLDGIAPGAVSDLTALPGALQGEVNLAWTAPGDDGTIGNVVNGSLHIIYATSAIPIFSNPPAASTSIVWLSTDMAAGSQQGYLLTGLNPGTTYFFALIVRDTLNWSSWSTSGVNALSSAAARDDPPSPPTGVAVTITSETAANISWVAPSVAAVDDRSKYVLYRASAAFSSPSQNWAVAIATLTHPTTFYHDFALYPGATYFYRLTSIDAGDQGSGIYSDPLEGALSAQISSAAFFYPPTGFSATVLSTGTLRWCWNDYSMVEFAYRVYSATGGLLSGDLAPNATCWDETGINANTQGSAFLVRAVTGTTESAPSIVAFSSYTFSKSPGTPTLSRNGTSSNSLLFSIDGGGNPSYTTFALAITSYSLTPWPTFYIQHPDGSLGATEEWITATAWNVGLTAVGLQPSTTYFLRVKGRNENGVETLYSPSASTDTLSGESIPPNNISDLTALTGPLDGDIYLAWSSPGDDGESGVLSSGGYRILWSINAFGMFTSTHSQSLSISTSGVSPGTPVGTLIRGLNPGTTYYFGVIAQDDSGNWSRWVKTASINTANFNWGSDLPLEAPQPSIVSQTETSVQISWVAPSSPTYVDDRGTYLIYYSSQSFSAVSEDGVILSSTVNHPITSFTQTGLSAFTTYYFRLVAADLGDQGSGLFSTALNSALSSAVSTRTSLNSPTAFGAAYASTSSVTWQWTDNSAQENGYQIFSSSGVAISTVLAAGTTFWAETGLSPNSQYARFVAALSSAGDVSASSSTSKATQAEPPGVLPYSNVTAVTLTANWSTRSNSTQTTYTIQFAQNSDFSPVILTIPGFSASNKFTFSDLTSNNTYWARVRASNQEGTDTAWTDLGSTQTLANSLTSPAVSNVTESGMTLTFNKGGNSPETELSISMSPDAFQTVYYVQASSGLGVSEAWQPESGWNGGTVTVSGLSPNVRYQIRIRARNATGAVTSFSDPTSSGTTLCQTPSVPGTTLETDETLGQHLHITIAADGNPSNTEYAIQYVEGGSWLQGDGSAASTAAWRTSAQWTASHSSNTHAGILAGSTYTYRVIARNVNGDLTAFSLARSTFITGSGGGTLSVQSASPSDGSTLFNVASPLRVTLNGSPASASLSGRVSLTAIRDNYGQSISSAIAGAVSVSNQAVVFTPASELAKGRAYRLTLSSGIQDASGNSLSADASFTFYTPFDFNATNIIRLSSPACTLTLSPGAFQENFSVSVQNPMSASVSGAPSLSEAMVHRALNKIQNLQKTARLINDSVVEINILNDGGARLSYPSAAVQLTVSYPDANQDGIVDGTLSPAIRETDLALYWLNEQSESFVKLPASDVDPLNNSATVVLPHFSIFGVLGAASTSLNDAHAYPVPFNAGRHSAITFTSLPAAATIRIYTLTGQHVRTLDEVDGDGEFVWDTKDTDGDWAASGVYLYEIKSATDQKKGKLIIVR